MTSPLSQMVSSDPSFNLHDPPRRTFGSVSRPNPSHSPSTSQSGYGHTTNDGGPQNTSPTPSSSQSHLPLPGGLQRPEANRHRSGSSVSLNSFERERESFMAAADKGITWLSGWAPKGEGRTRQFLNSSLNGVATVASTVGSGVSDAVNDLGLGVKFGTGTGSNSGTAAANDGWGMSRDTRLGRPSSFQAASPTETTTPYPEGSLNARLAASVSSSSIASAASVPPPVVGGMHRLSITSPPGPQHTVSSPAVAQTPAQRRIPQPSNLARLGSVDSILVSDRSSSNITVSGSSAAPNVVGGRPTVTVSSSTSAVPSVPRSTSISGPTIRGPHGSSLLNPNVSPNPSGASGSSATRGSVSYHHRSGSFAKSPSLSRSSSTTAGGGLARSAGMPYKIGFQPAGVRNDRSLEFTDARKNMGEEREKEEGRLGRRWAKLVDLHFNPATQLPNQAGPDIKQPSLPRSASSRRSLLSVDGALEAMKPKEMWKGLISATAAPGAAEENRKRAEEQGIVKWEDDKEVKKCRICQSSFTLSNRKHHCRLCGRIVCSLPPTNPALLAVQVQLFSPADPSTTSQSTTSPTNIASTGPQSALPPGTRREKCSLLLVADWRSGRGEEVEEGFVGWMNIAPGAEDEGLSRERNATSPRKSGMSRTSSISSTATAVSSVGKNEFGEGRTIPLPQQPKEVQIKGMRVCRECWAVVSYVLPLSTASHAQSTTSVNDVGLIRCRRKQKMQDRQRVTGFAKLYAALRQLQAEIEEAMVDFEGHMEVLSAQAVPTDPPPSLLKQHKNLIALFAQYEHISKRLSSSPAEEGGSQSQVQSAVARSSALFLAKQMAKVQALPRLQKLIAAEKRRSMKIVDSSLSDHLMNESSVEEAEDDVAVTLQPLLEQEAQLESYIADANAQRKYEDGKALSEALSEIRAEIARVTQRAVR